MLQPSRRLTISFFLLAIFQLWVGIIFSPSLHAQAGVAPKLLIEPSTPDAGAQVVVNSGVVATTAADGISVIISPSDNAYPGVTIKPAGGAPSWNLGLYGHVEAKITNTGSKPIDLCLRVDNDGDYHLQPWSAESKKINPGQTKTIRVYFGYSYGFKPSFKLNPQAVNEVILFTGKTTDPLSFRVDSIEGAGWLGEKIGIDPDHNSVKPPGGVLLDPSTTLQPSQIGANENAKGSLGADGKSLQLDFDDGKQGSVTFRPATGLWNLNEHLEVKVKVKNTGAFTVTPFVRVESENGPTDTVAADAPLAPGAETEIAVPFAAKVPWKGLTDPSQEDHNGPSKGWGHEPGTGTDFRSNFTTGVTILSDASPGAKSLQVTSIIADQPPLNLPDWLGKRPPVDGAWVQTLDENFDGDTIDLHRWNVHCANWWDKRMHFSKDDVIVKDGTLALRMEKKTGPNNDGPPGQSKYSGAVTDYAAGQPDTGRKWTQRYGYFEVREKQSTANCLWPGFWMVADGSVKNSNGIPGNGGTEFDITESQSAWGVHRFNIACHWDGYAEHHKSLGTSSNYVQTDKDGFITVGMLWLPGSMTIYGNGKEIFHWESPRISNQEECLILQNEIGGWDNEPVNDAQLPADFLVDYIRVWQRKDLASPDDGPKPNKGDLDAFNEPPLPQGGTK